MIFFSATSNLLNGTMKLCNPVLCLYLSSPRHRTPLDGLQWIHFHHSDLFSDVTERSGTQKPARTAAEEQTTSRPGFMTSFFPLLSELFCMRAQTAACIRLCFRSSSVCMCKRRNYSAHLPDPSRYLHMQMYSSYSEDMIIVSPLDVQVLKPQPRLHDDRKVATYVLVILVNFKVPAWIFCARRRHGSND